MKNMNVVRSVFLMGIALTFGLISIRYPMGQFSRPGPGLFPLVVSSLLLAIGLILLIRAFLVDAVALNYNVKNISIVLAAMLGFALISKVANMTLGILFLVFCSSRASSEYSFKRNLQISVVLLAIAMAFKFLLSLNLPLL